MALLFGGVSSDNVSYGSAAALDDLANSTVVLWLYRTGTWAIGDTKVLGNKGSFNNNPIICLMGNGNFTHADDEYHLEVYRQLSTTSINFGGNSTLAINTWYFVAMTISSGNVGEFFVGSLTSSVASDGTATGSGTIVGSNAAANQFCGGTGATDAFLGRIAYSGLYDRVLSIGELASIQFQPKPLSGCLIHSFLGFNGVGAQPDWSGNGNSGTVTGATVADHVPLGTPFGVDPGWYDDILYPAPVGSLGEFDPELRIAAWF